MALPRTPWLPLLCTFAFLLVGVAFSQPAKKAPDPRPESPPTEPVTTDKEISNALNGKAPRQYYSEWHRHGSFESFKYFYRHYFYKPTPSYYGYRHHYAIYYPARPTYYYYYNPYQNKFYGRSPVVNEGKPTFSWLRPEDQHGDITKIDESKFPVPDGLSTPPLPESKPENEANGKAVTMDLPPGEPPSDPFLRPLPN